MTLMYLLLKHNKLNIYDRAIHTIIDNILTIKKFIREDLVYQAICTNNIYDVKRLRQEALEYIVAINVIQQANSFEDYVNIITQNVFIKLYGLVIEIIDASLANGETLLDVPEIAEMEALNSRLNEIFDIDKFNIDCRKFMLSYE